MSSGSPRLAVIADYPEEGWPSMDLVAEMLLKHLAGSELVRAERVCPRFRRRLGWAGGAGRNFDRLANRLWDYPRYLRGRVGEFDLFHLCDHSYSQVIHELPGVRVGVMCHDLDTFRCLLEPEKERRPRWFRAMVRRILAGLQKARVVFYLTEGVREQIERFGVVDPAKLVRAPVAAAEEFVYREGAKTGEGTYLLHVGSCIPRKRIDVLLRVFAGVSDPGLKLVQVGGEWTVDQRALIGQLGIGDRVQQLRGLSRAEVAELYRGAAVVLQTSEAEGFGLPVVEGLACGAVVVASDIPVLREVGGDAAVYCPVGDVGRWVEVVRGILEGAAVPALDTRLARAARFSWAEHARVVAGVYRAMAGVG
jgi:glycosyltransferase involved in cell wall biosynthesis